METTTMQDNQYCGSPLWSAPLTWWTSIPDITPCFQFAVVRRVPCLWFWLVMPLKAITYYHRDCQRKKNGQKTSKFKYSSLTVTKLATYSFVAAALFGELVQSIALFAAQVMYRPAVHFLAPSIELITIVAVAFTVCYERRNGYIASGVLWFFWLFTTMCCLVVSYSAIINYFDIYPEIAAPRFSNETALLDSTAAITDGQNIGLRWNVDVSILVLVLLRLIATLISFGLGCVADHEVDPVTLQDDLIITEFGGRASAELSAGFLSRLMMGWMWPVVKRGSSKSLEPADLFSLNPTDRCSSNAPLFERVHYERVAAWRVEQNELALSDATGKQKAAPKRGAEPLRESQKRSKLDGSVDASGNGKDKVDANANPKMALVIDDDEEQAGGRDEASRLMNKQDINTTTNKQYSVAKPDSPPLKKRSKLLARRKEKAKETKTEDKNGKAEEKPKEKPKSAFELDKTKYPSALKSLFIVYWKDLLRAHSCKVLQDVMLFSNTMVVGQLISFSDDPQRNSYAWKGGLFTLALAMTQLVQCLTMQHTFHIGMRCGMHMRTSITTALYRKALSISNSARAKATLGEIVNLMSVDAQRLQDMIGYCWAFWSCPEQIIVACILIWFQMGPATFAGLATMICFVMPLNMFVAAQQRKLQVQQMRNKDERMKQVNELMAGIRLVKLYAWEIPFRRRVANTRDRELEILRRTAYLGVIQNFIFTFAPFLVAVVTFAVFVATSDEELTAKRAFVTLSLFQILRFPMGILPMIIQMSVTASVAVKRISRFLAQPDLNEANVSRDSNPSEPITLDNATFGWVNNEQADPDVTDRAILRDVTLHVRNGELLAVVGRVGAGKSTLISTILGETELYGGKVNVSGRVAYVAQQSWIQNATLRDNILFGSPFDEEKYQRIVAACALEADLAMLPGGDNTEIGEKGINLSGGQKQRVALARALYADCDIYLFDDPLSAVDVHVGRHIFNQVVGPRGLLRSKTRVFVTHGLHWLRECDRVAVIDPQLHKIVQLGRYDDLVAEADSFLLNNLHLDSERKTQESAENGSEEASAQAAADADGAKAQATEDKVKQVDTKDPESEQNKHNGAPSSADGDASKKPGSPKNGQAQKLLTREQEEEAIKAALKKQEEQKLIQEEKRETGRVKLKVYLAYFKAQALPLFIVFVVAQGFVHALFIVANWWISVWTEDPKLVGYGARPDCSISNSSAIDYNSTSVSLLATVTPTVIETITSSSLGNVSSCLSKTERDDLRRYYLLIYAAIGLIVALMTLASAVFAALGSLRASRVLHAGMLDRILHVPMSFFDTTPTGRILNRFSKDVDIIDSSLPHTFRGWLQTMFGVMFTIVGVCIGTPLSLAIIIPAGIVFFFVQRFFVPTSRQLKRIESTSKSPVFTHFSESLQGRATIRAFGAQERFVVESERRTDRNNVYCFLGLAANRWIAMNLDFISSLFVSGAAAFCVIASLSWSTTGGRVGLSLTYALTVAQSLNWMVRMNSEIETNVVSVERIQEYSELDEEAAWERSEAELAREGISLPSDWPTRGEIQFDEYSTRYRENLDLVLRDISVRLQPTDKVGIIGRTGAGKSSFTLALFRMVEAVRGRIIIDGVDISRIGVHQLRSRLTILPQDPVIFAGTLRSNLDPFDTHTDEQVWNALELAGLHEHFAQIENGLLHECAEGGSNLSVGQRQLVCLARALLRKTKVLVLDEATAAVDLRTDELIQRTIRSAFADCSVITIAHRLNTIMDYDRILVLDRGAVKELDSPDALLARPDSVFANMVRESQQSH